MSQRWKFYLQLHFYLRTRKLETIWFWISMLQLISYDPMFFSDFLNFFENNFDNTVFSIVLFYTLQCFEFFCSRCAWLT